MSNKKSLVAYFSCSGVTKKLATTLAEAASADIYEIKPEVPYTKSDLDWRDDNSRSTIEMKDKSSRPKIANRVSNMEQYDIVFVGFPIWWYVAPTIINTFLESYDFSDKTIIPFETSGGSEMGNTVQVLKKITPDSVSWKSGKKFSGNTTKEVLGIWVEGLNL